MSPAPALQALRAQLQNTIVGQHDLLERLILALLAGGHVLLEGPPGLAKTTAVHALAAGVDASFQRIQFTPDLMPGDLTGSEVYDPAKSQFRFVAGPLFHEMVLADEINRAPPKVQSALLEAMAEHQITVGAETRGLPSLFMVLATQNPLEQSGTYPLPEAQLDRFLFHVLLDYPSVEEEVEIARRARKAVEGHVEKDVKPVLTPQAILAMRAELDHIHIEPRIEHYAVQLVSATREPGKFLEGWADRVMAGASPRGSIALLRAACARAWLEGRDYVLPDDVRVLAADVLRHRIVLDYAALAEGLTAQALIDALLETIPSP